MRVNKWLLACACLLTTFLMQAQTVDSIEYNGEHYYVYPFRKEVHIHREYWKVVDDDSFFADYNNYFNYFEGDFMFSREKFQTAKTQKRKEKLQKDLEERWKRIRRGKKFGKKATQSIRQNPGALIQVAYDHESDLLPPFESIPDGKYVQLFDDYCAVDENGKYDPKAYRVAGVFTIKNNIIDGEAVWMNFSGVKVKMGSFNNGLKEGEWTIKYPNELGYRIDKLDRKRLKNGEEIDVSYTAEVAHFQKGLNHGKYDYLGFYDHQRVTGQFELGEPTGEWIYQTNDQITCRVQMADLGDTSVSRKPILRTGELVRPREYYRKENGEYIPYEMRCQEAPMPNFPGGFYTIPFNTHQDDLELAGERDNSYELTDRDYITDDYYISPFSNESDFETTRFDALEYDNIQRKRYPRWFIIDSLGAHMRYDGVYEQYYMNGQLFFRYEFKNGELVREDTLFWDNGQVLDVIEFHADSNKYHRSLYDRQGYLYDVLIYDSLGAFERYLKEYEEESDEVIIDGLVATQNGWFSGVRRFEVDAGFYYVDEDLLSSDSLQEKVIITRTWAWPDTSLQLNVVYDPLTREYISEKYNCFGEIHTRTTRTFTETFSGWTGTEFAKYGDVELKGTWSGVRHDWDEVDTLNHQSVSYANEIYRVTSDHSIFYKGELFTGDFDVKRVAGLMKLKTRSDKIDVHTSRGLFGYNKFGRAQRKKKKAKRFMLESFTNDNSFDLSNAYFEYDFGNYFQDLMYNYNGYLTYSAFDNQKGVRRVEGQFLDGKAHGLWTTYDKKGEVVSTLNFVKGEPDGEMKMYNYQRKKPKHVSYYFNPEDFYLDSFPEKRTRYLQYVVNFKNGQREGSSIQYDWLGRVVKSADYKDGWMDGKLIFNEFDSRTEATFKDGLLDGYFRTKMITHSGDSILLYDINLQNGRLNGESKAYHTNGRLAKRGFFLDDEPIQDYEAYDTLGFKYHYVKFQYGMPVEEKIWEENALSIRYQFDWRDSIYFYPSDITSTESLEALLVREGYKSHSSDRKYYGRPSLISKIDVDCRMTKYYPNDTIARDGRLEDRQKVGHWKFYGYNGTFLYEVNYFDSIIALNDSIRFKSKGILTDYDDNGNRLYSAYIIEKFEKYDCAHTDHYEIRQLLTIDEENDSTGRMNGYVYNFYDNGTIQSEGNMKNGAPDGLWKFYDPFGKLNKMGNYVLGKRNGRWLEGDLAKKKYLGEICMNPNLPDLEKQQKYQENLLDITIINYMMGRLMNTQYYDVNMNRVIELEENRTAE